MADRARYYLTTSIAYANNKPGLHTLYEVIGADAIARWHRMLGDDTRFLTGTDEHSINIAQAAVDEGRPTREFVDEKVALFKSAEDALAITPDRFIRTTDPDHVARRAGDGPPRPRQRRHLPRHVRGLVLPQRGLPQRVGRPRDAARDDLPEPSRRPAPVADRAQLVLPAVGLPGAARAPLRRPPGLRPARLPAQRDARLHPGRARGLLDQPRADPGRLGDPVPDRRERRDGTARGRLVGPRGGQDLRLVRRADQLHHGRRLPGRSRRVRPLVAGRPAHHRQGHRPLPLDLLAGDAVERRPRAAAPRLGPRLPDRRRRRADEQEPRQLPRPGRFRRDIRLGRRALRRAARGAVRSRRGGVVGLVRAALQRGPRQRLREPRQPDRVDDQPLPGRGAAGAARVGRVVAPA